MSTITTTQRNFNRFIRLRDSDDNGFARCITCKRSMKFGTDTYHAGHFYSAGSYPSLRFNEDNVHSQCKRCNKYLSANLLVYRENLIYKLGQDKFDILTSMAKKHKAKKYYGFELEAINKEYLDKCKTLMKLKMF